VNEESSLIVTLNWLIWCYNLFDKSFSMTYPILEHDSTPNAFIEPAKVINPRNVPEHCVICFFREVMDKVVAEHDAKIVVENRWEDGPHPVYEISYRDQRLAFFHPGIGAPLAASLLEEVIAFGCRKFIACGGCGVLEKDIAVGNIIIVSAAIRDEGVSYHYIPPGREIIANEVAINALTNILRNRGVPYRIGKTWTTDAPYRETPIKIAKRKEDGCLTVEMESAGMMAVAQFRGVIFGQVLYGGDDLSGTEWDHRAWQSRDEIRESLFWLCADACLNL
jgi:uridine phosphorylase